MSDSKRKVIWAGMLGNCLELYDYVLYGFFAALFSKLFFPEGSPLIALIASYGIYATGFVFRPLGGLLFGSIGDKLGRKRAMELSVLMMAVPTVLIGLLPTYASIGLAAPLLLVLMRLLQGMSVGGELVGSYAFLVEHADSDKRYFAGSMTIVGAFAGKVLGVVVIALLSTTLTEQSMESFGWRLPFFLGFFFATAGFFLRRRVEETPIFLELKNEGAVVKTPIRDALKHDWGAIGSSIFFLMGQTAPVHLLFVYFPNYMRTELGMPLSEALWSNFLALVVAMGAMAVGAKGADRIGAPTVMRAAFGLFSVLIIPAFLLIASGSALIVISMHALLSLVFGIAHGPAPTYFIDFFHAERRVTAGSIAYNLGVLTFGGLAPIAVTLLIAWTGSLAAPSLWILFCTIGTLISLSRNPLYDRRLSF
ncbi:MAG: MFS transporter [Chlamydiia bacterium]|nr:MFS transporter [Chlamydiia bacterium]